MRALLLGLAACGSAPAPATPVANRAAPPPRPACSEDRVAELTDHLRAQWQLAEDPLVRCVPGRFPTPGYYLAVHAGRDRHATGIVTADDLTELSAFTDSTMMVATSMVDSATVDLDGDGTDEIVETWRKSAHGAMGSETWLVVRRLVKRELARIEGPHTSVYHPELGSCSAEVQLAGRTIVITVAAISRLPPSDCLPPGTHTFALDGDRLVKLARPTP